MTTYLEEERQAPEGIATMMDKSIAAQGTSKLLCNIKMLPSRTHTSQSHYTRLSHSLVELDC